ncbi:MAG TPA: hypothetical protein VMV56_07685 [Williamwhitmania sp.]|nr:hypothetical protein [Williamwhitmania sp.]
MDDIEDRQDQLINEVLNRLDDLSRLDTIFNTKHIPVPVDSPYAVPLPFYVDSLIFKIVPWEYEVYGKSKIKVMWDPVYYKEDRCGIEIFLDHDIHHYHLDIGQEDYFETTLLDTGLYYISVRAYPTKVDTFYLNDQMIIAPYYWPPSARSDSVRYHCEEL